MGRLLVLASERPLASFRLSPLADRGQLALAPASRGEKTERQIKKHKIRTFCQRVHPEVRSGIGVNSHNTRLGSVHRNISTGRVPAAEQTCLCAPYAGLHRPPGGSMGSAAPRSGSSGRRLGRKCVRQVETASDWSALAAESPPFPRTVSKRGKLVLNLE